MRDVLAAAIDAAIRAGASYADARVIDSREERLSVTNGRVEAIESGETFGIGVRVISDGSWGFAAAADVSPDAAVRLGRCAVDVARASGLVRGRPVRLSPVKTYEATWAGPCEVDPFAVSLEDKIAMLLEADEAMRVEDAVKITKAQLGSVGVHSYFASSEGSYIEQRYVDSGAGISAVAIANGDVITRSYPNSHGGDWARGGFEVIRGFGLANHAPRVAEEAAALLAAPACPSAVTDLIIDGSQLGLQVHESIGHPIELDRVLGDEAAFAGTSFLSVDGLGNLRYGSDHVTVTADATIAESIGGFGFDDEGVPAQRDYLVSEGVLTGFLTSRESALSISRTSNGCMRADGWNRIPLIRMTTVSLEPGAWSLEDLIADTDDGLYIETNSSWSIDDKRLNFQFGCEIGWEIKNGKRGRMVKNPNYTGITPHFWGSCDAVCSRDHWRVWGLVNCGKGEPMQVARVAHGAAPARFRGIQVGVGR